MVDRIYPVELQLSEANSSDSEAPFLDLNYSYLMVQFPLKFVINVTISISVRLMSRSLMARPLGVPRMECTYLNIFVSLQHILTLVTSIVVTKP